MAVDESRPEPARERSSDLVARIELVERELARLKTTIAPRRPPRPAAPSGTPSALEASVGLAWTGRAGAAAVAAAMILTAVWAHDRGWLTPAVRYLGGAAVAAVVLWIGMRWALGERPGMARVGRAIAFIGVAGLFVSPAAAYRLDGIIGADLACSATVAVMAGLAVAAWRNARFLASFAIPGAAALALWWPALAGAPVATLAFLGTVGAVTTAAQRGAGRADAWTALFAAAFQLWWLASDASHGPVALAGTVLWALCLAHSAAHRRRLRDTAWTTALTAMAAATGAGLLFGTAPLGPARVALACALVGAQAVLLERDRKQRAALLLLVAVAVAALAGGAGAPNAATAATAASILPLPLWALYVRAARASGPLHPDEYLLGHGAAAIVGLGWGIMARGWNQPWMAAPALTCLSLAWLLFANTLAGRSDRVAAGGWALVSGTVAAVAGFLAGLSYLPLDRPTGSMLATAVAAAGAVSLVATGIRQRTLIPRAAGLVGLAACVVKAIAVDLWFLSSGARIGALAALGAGLLGASFLYGRWTDGEPDPSRYRRKEK